MATSYVPHLRLSFGGNLGTSVAEIWSNTLRFNVIGSVPTRDQLETACAAVIPAISQWMARSTTKISNQATLRWVKLNWVQADGKQRDTDTVLFELLVPVAGNDSQSIPPYFQTFALTLRTRTRRGRGHSGRIFPPMVVFSAEGGTPYTTAAIATGMANSLATMIRDARSAMALTWQDQGVGLPDLAVFSAGSTTAPVRQPMMTLVTGVVVDRTPDVQHRRTNRVPRAEGDTVLLDP